MKIPFVKSALAQFHSREKEIDGMADVLSGLQKIAAQVGKEIESARAAYIASPTVENARAWEDAFRRVSPGPGGSRFNVAEALLSGERLAVLAKQNEARRSSEYVAIVGRALAERNAEIQASHDTKRKALSESLTVNGENNANLDNMPTLRGLIERVARNRDAIARLAHPDCHARGIAIECAVAYINEPVDYVAPAPPAPRQMQGFVAGGNLPTNHGVMNPTNPTPDTALPTVPPEVAQAIRQQLVEQQNKHFREQERQMTERLAAEREAARAKLAQAEAVA